MLFRCNKCLRRYLLPGSAKRCETDHRLAELFRLKDRIDSIFLETKKKKAAGEKGNG